MSAHYRVHAGMREAVAEARSRSGVAVGLGTGNVREGARVKLERVGIYDHFAFGGFGCDHEDRVELIRHGARGRRGRWARPSRSAAWWSSATRPRTSPPPRASAPSASAWAPATSPPRRCIDAGADFAFPDFSAPGAMEALLQDR